MSYFDPRDQPFVVPKDEKALFDEQEGRSDLDEAVVLGDDDSSVKPLSETEVLADKILHGEAVVDTPALSTALDSTAFTPLPTPGDTLPATVEYEEDDDEGYGGGDTTPEQDLADAQGLLAVAAVQQSRTGDLLEEAGDLAASQDNREVENAIQAARVDGLDSAKAIVDARGAVLDAQIEQSVYDDETNVDGLASRLVEESADPSGTPTTVDDDGEYEGTYVLTRLD
jgi:hypothetical protein